MSKYLYNHSYNNIISFNITVNVYYILRIRNNIEDMSNDKLNLEMNGAGGAVDNK